MTSRRIRIALLGLASVILIAASGHVAPSPALLAWDNTQVILFPDSADGTLVVITQLYRTPRPDKPLHYVAFIDPDAASAWIPSARAFLKIDAPASDTHRVAASVSLVSQHGEAMFFARRKSDSGWTADRYLGLRPHVGRPAQYINLQPRAADEFLDSLAAVVLRTPVLASPRAPSFPAVDDTGDCIVPLPNNEAPRYPADERSRGVEGNVWASFVLTDRGTVDRASVHVLFATTPSFGRAVFDAVPQLRFEPLRRNGRAVSKRIVMPFQFQLTRPGETWPRKPPNNRCD